MNTKANRGKSPTRIKALCLCAALLAALAANGQINYQYAEGPGASWYPQGIIRNWNDAYAIAYYERGGTGYFVGLDPSNTVSHTNVPLPQGWSVRDFRILDDKVFFCGTNYSNGTPIALLGYCQATDIFNSPGNCAYHHSDMSQCKVWVLARLAVSNAAGPVSLLAIGREDVTVDYTIHGNDKAVYYDDYIGNPSPALFNLIVGQDTTEKMYDVVATENWFATVGKIGYHHTYHQLGSGFLSVRKVQIGTPSLTFHLSFEQRHTFYNHDVWLGRMSATPLHGDDMAVSSLYAFEDIYGTEIYNIDITNMIVHTDQRFYMDSKADPEEMTFLSNENLLVLTEMMYTTVPIGQSGYIHLEPYNTASSYSAAEHYSNSTTTPWFRSVDAMGGSTYFGAGQAVWFYTTLPGISSQNSCITVGSNRVINLEPPTGVIENHGIHDNCSTQILILFVNVGSEQYNNICIY